MTVLMDRVFTKMGFEDEELKSSPLRGFLYFGIVFMLGVTTAFLIMAILG